MESFNTHLEDFLANDVLFSTVTCSTISIVVVLLCFRTLSDGPEDGHFDELEDQNSANGVAIFLVSLVFCISSLAGLAAYLQHGTAILKWAYEISSDEILVSAVAVLLIALGVFVLVAEFEKRGAVLPILQRPVEEQVEVSPLEIAVEDFVLDFVITTFNIVIRVVTFPGYTIKVLYRSVAAFGKGSKR
jgi:hypothetical protein